MQGPISPALLDVPEYDAEKASNSYLMSVAALMVGVPLPVVNLIATGIFYFGNRRASYFVRWHCTQVLLAQFLTVLMNGSGLYWTLSIVFGDAVISNRYISYIITILLFNLFELVVIIRSMVLTRKGIHISWWFFGPMADLLTRR